MANRIFITGDTHGPREISRIGRALGSFEGLDKSDYLIVLGDFGLVWADRSAYTYWLRWLDKKPFTTLFVDGNHENFDMLDALPVECWNGASVHRVNDSVLHLMRGGVFDIAGRSFFCMGGARSVDRARRTPHVSWWPREMPDAAERERACAALRRRTWRVDYALSHCAPASVQRRLNPSYEQDDLTLFLDGIERRLEYRHWFFGHYHEDRAVGEAQTAVFERVFELRRRDDGSDEIACVFGT